MIITRTPMRVSFVGGATDIENYYSQYRGEVISCAINKYIYITVNKRDDDKIIISYSRIENVKSINHIKHNIVREALKLANINKGIEIHIISDISTIGTGLGGSSSVTVGILQALFKDKTNKEIAELACHLEINILKKQIGKQDQYACACGGINHLTFEKDGKVNVNYIGCHDIMKNHFYLLNFNGFKNKRKKAEKILEKQNHYFEKNVYILHQIKNLCRYFKMAIVKGSHKKVIEILNHYYELKKQLEHNGDDKNTTDFVKKFVNSGCGVKSCGAGQNGYFFIYDPSDKCQGLPVKIDYSGVKIIE